MEDVEQLANDTQNKLRRFLPDTNIADVATRLTQILGGIPDEIGEEVPDPIFDALHRYHQEVRPALMKAMCDIFLLHAELDTRRKTQE